MNFGYSEQVLPVPWEFTITGVDCINEKTWVKGMKNVETEDIDEFSTNLYVIPLSLTLALNCTTFVHHLAASDIVKFTGYTQFLQTIIFWTIIERI